MPQGSEPLNSRAHSVGPDYFRTLGIPVLRGRGIDWHDDGDGEPVAVVDEVAAARLWPDQDPLGRRLQLRGGGGEETWYSVVGVAGSIHQWSLAENPTSHIYVPGVQRSQPYGRARVVIRSPIPSGALIESLRAAIWEVDPNVPVPVPETMEARIAEDLRDPRFNVALVGSFSLSAMLLSAGGIYALMLCLVAARTREIGIRSALGASHRAGALDCLPPVPVPGSRWVGRRARSGSRVLPFDG
jgi:putative ABC transport system permease protein